MDQFKINKPFFEIGPKSYLYGNDVIELARAADIASEKYDVDIIFTTPPRRWRFRRLEEPRYRGSHLLQPSWRLRRTRDRW